MPQITAALIINDGQATPVAKSFAPERVSPEQSTFVERSAASSAGFIRLGLATKFANSQRPSNRVDVSLDYPVLQTVNGVTSVAYTARFKGYFVLPDTMTAAERANAQAYVANAMANSVFKAAVKDLDPAY